MIQRNNFSFYIFLIIGGVFIACNSSPNRKIVEADAVNDQQDTPAYVIIPPDPNFPITSINKHLEFVDGIRFSDTIDIRLEKATDNLTRTQKWSSFRQSNTLWKVTFEANYLDYYHPLIELTDSLTVNKFNREYYYRNGFVVYIHEQYTLDNKPDVLFENEYYLAKDSLIKWNPICCDQDIESFKIMDTVLTKFTGLDIIDLLTKGLLQPKKDVSVYGKTDREAIEKWIDLKKLQNQDSLNVYILDMKRQYNKIGIVENYSGSDTLKSYYILDFSYHSYNPPNYVELSQRHFGRDTHNIDDILSPGDAMLYLRHLYLKNDTISIKKLLAPNLSLTSLGLIDFTSNYCNFGLDNNYFNDVGEGHVSFNGGGWGDTYTWRKTKSAIVLINVSRYSH